MLLLGCPRLVYSCICPCLCGHVLWLLIITYFVCVLDCMCFRPKQFGKALYIELLFIITMEP